MDTKLKDYKSGSKYRVMSVQKTSTPEGMPDDNWFHYVIGQGQSKIEGFRTGTLKNVTEHAETVAEDLNARKGKGFTTPVSRKKK